MENLLKETKILNYTHPSLLKLIKERGWEKMNEYDKIGGIYNFVKDEIPFGYNESDNILVSQVLSDGLGQCNTKGTLFMALLRAVGVPCRIHGFTVRKQLLKGVISKLFYPLAGKGNILHSWVEMHYQGKWINIEGFIIDKDYLNKLQNKFSDSDGDFCGYGVGVKDFKNPSNEWNGCDTYIQGEGIEKDFGVFDSPDDFYAKHPDNLARLPGWKRFVVKNILYKWMNENIQKVRKGIMVFICKSSYA